MSVRQWIRVVVPSGSAVIGLIGLLASTSTPLAAPQTSGVGSGTPIRDASASQTKTGTAVIRGRVVRAGDGQPLRGVRVRANADVPDQFTDDEGRFAFTSLPAGTYIVWTVKGGYVSVARGSPGRATSVGPSIQLADGQVEAIDFAMPKGGVVSGRVIDQNGRVVEGAFVSVYRWTWIGGM